MKSKSDTKIAYLRLQAGLTQKSLAAAAGVNIRAIQNFEGGERKIEDASLRIALRIADALGVDPRELI